MVALAPGFEGIPTVTGPMTRNVEDLVFMTKVVLPYVVMTDWRLFSRKIYLGMILLCYQVAGTILYSMNTRRKRS